MLVPSQNDDEWLYYTNAVTLPAPSIRRIHPDGTGDSVAVTDRVVGFTATANGLWFVARPKLGEVNNVVRVLRFADNTIHDVARIDFPYAGGMSVSPDERYVLLSRPDLSGSDLLLVNNFR